MTITGMRLGRAVLRLSAIVSVVLLLNALALAPLFHRHGDLHDPHTCAICIVQATGSVAPPPAAVLPHAAACGLRVPLPHAAPPAPQHTHVIPARGPPSPSMDRI